MHKLFSWLFRAGARPPTAQDVLDAMRTLTGRLEAMDERVDRMDGQLRRMRGYVYAKKGAVLDTFGSDGAPPPSDRKAWLNAQAKQRRLTKPELRELAGLAPLGSAPPPAEAEHHE